MAFGDGPRSRDDSHARLMLAYDRVAEVYGRRAECELEVMRLEEEWISLDAVLAAWSHGQSYSRGFAERAAIATASTARTRAERIEVALADSRARLTLLGAELSAAERLLEDARSVSGDMANLESA